MWKMLRLIQTIILLVTVCFVIVHAETERFKNDGKQSKYPETVTPSGVIRGSWMETRKDRLFEAYRGIPYAEPPVGDMRFQPPKLILNYSKPIHASAEGPACPLYTTKADYYLSEDCLKINVYTPVIRNKNLPVIFYIHSGGFYSMSGRSDITGPHYLLDRDVVLVTINYRLGTLVANITGFLSTGTKEAPGNNGFHDQVVALRWVQRNIASFGGNPGLVTLVGCSAGSYSVMLHMVSTMSKGLFHRAISISGSPTSKVPAPRDNLVLAIRQAELVNCTTKTIPAMVACLKTVPWRRLGDSINGFYEFGYDPVGLWRPVVEKDFGQERFLSIDPMDAIRQKKIHSVPYIISQNKDEFFYKAYTVLNNQTLLNTMNSEWHRIAPISFMLPRNNSDKKVDRLKQFYLKGRPLVNDSATADGLGKLYGDAITGFPVHRLANLMCRHSPQPVYYYELTYIGNRSHYEDPVTKKPKGVAHHDDLLYLFTIGYRFPAISTSSPDSFMVDRMTAIVYNFARFGNPNPRNDTPELRGLSWPTMKPEDRKYLRIDKQFSVETKLKEDRFKVWDEVYPIRYE